MNEAHNNDSSGAAQAKTGENRLALSRYAGMAATVAAIGSTTGSAQIPANGSKNWPWHTFEMDYGDSGNIKT